MTRMVDGGTGSLRARPIAVVVFGAMLTVVLLVALGWGAWAVYAAQRSAQETAYRTQFLLSRIALLDEVATRSARMAAVSGDLAWREQYREVESALATAIQGLARDAANADDSEAARRMEAASRQMIRIEHAAFERVEQGQGSAALRLLSSDDYNRQKAILGSSVEDLSDAVREFRRAHGRSAQRRLLLGGLLTTLGALVLFGIWTIVFFRLRHYIAERDRAEAEVRASETKFGQVVENIREVFWIIDPVERRLLYVSPAWEAIWGRSVERAHEEPAVFIESVHPEDRERIASAVAGAASDGFNQTYRIVRPDGAIRWIRARGFSTPETGEGGPRLVGVAEDITERKETEEARRASEERLRALIDASPLPILAVDRDGKMTLWNSAAERILGWTREEVLGRPNPLVPQEKQEQFRTLEDRVLRGEPFTGLEVQGKRKNGTLIDLRLSTAPLNDASGAVTGAMAVLEDITEKKRAQAAVRESERRLSTLVRSLPGVVYRSRNDPRWTMEYIGGRTEELFGYAPEQLLGDAAVSPASLIHPEDRDAVRKGVQEAIGAREPFQLEYRLRTAGGEEKCVWEQGEGVFSSDGKLEMLEGFITDVTELKRAEERERQLLVEKSAREHSEAAQERIRGILESITDAFFAVDEHWLFTYVNSQVEALTGRSRDELLGRNLWELFPTPPESRAWTEMHRALEEQVTVEFEEYGPNTGIWARVRAYPGEEGLTVYVRDITDRKRAEVEADLEHRRLEAVLDALPMGVFAADVGGRITLTNEAARRIWEIEDLPQPDHPDGYRAYRGWWPKTGQQLEGREWGLARALSGESVDEQEVVIETFEGAKKTILNYARPIVNGAGEQVGAVAALMDITERRRAEEALHESQLTMEAILSASPDIIEMLDLEGRFRWVSPAVNSVLGYRVDEVTGRPMQDLLPPENREAFESSLHQLMAGETDEVRLRYAARHRDGHWVRMEGRGRAIRTDVLRGLVLVGRDVTEQERLLESLIAAKDAAEAGSRAKSELLSRTSHELRTPLNAILGFAQILELEVEREEDRDSVKQILRAGRHLVSLIDEVLDIARAESGQMELPLKPVHLGEALEQACSLLRPLARQRQVELPRSPQAACDVCVLADSKSLKQVLLNLLSNAIKYNRQGGRVEITCEGAQGNQIRIRVSDTGPGIPPETFSRLFRPFDRLDAEKSSARTVEGTGLGLALSKALTHAMGGEIGAESEPGEGSTFWIELPRAPNDPAILSESTPEA